MRGFILVLLLAVAFASQHVPGVSDSDAYQQLTALLARLQTSQNPSDTSVAAAILKSELWQTLNAQFGTST